MANTLTRTLRTELKPPAPTDLLPGLEKRQEEAKQAETEASAAVTGLEQQKLEAETKAEAARAKQYVETTEEAKQRLKEKEEPYLERQKALDKAMMEQHFEPSKENLTDQMALFSLLNVVGFAIGAGGKQNAQAAMAAMNGMLEGHQKGREDLYKQERTTFDKNLKTLQQQATFIEKELSRALQEYTRDKDAGLQRADMVFAQAKAEFMKTYAQKAGLVKTYEMAKEVRKNLDKAIEKEQQRQLRNEDKAREDVRHRELILATTPPKETKNTFEFVTKGDKTYAINKNNPSDIREVNVDLSGAIKVGAQPKGGAGGTQQQFENITSADIGNAYFRVNEFLAKSKEGKIPEGSKFLRDKGTQSGVIDAYKNWMVNRSLPSDLQENDAALLGIAFDVVAARSFGRSAGVTDAKIAQVVKQLPVEGDSETTKQAKMRMLLNQLEEPNRLLPEGKKVNGFTYMTSPVSKDIYTQYGGKDTSAKKPMPTGEKLTTYTQTHPEFDGDEEKAKAFLRTQGYE